MVKKLSLISASLMMMAMVFIGACANNSSQVTEDEATEAPEEGVYGAGISADRYMDFKAVMAEMEAKDTVQTTFVATVNEVCQAKGCWMTLNDGQGSTADIMVRFKDYGFFVPKDIGGRQVVVEGKAFKTVTPVEELRHYAEDAGKSKEEIEAITEPENTFSFEATGVKVLNKEG